jgi:deoxyinosine 3'endonuclease (endonuclease V)
MICAALAVLDFLQLKPIQQAVVEIPFSFPCISFRQTPGILAALMQLSQC